VALDCDLDRKKRRGAMMLRPVELNSSRYPGTCESNECRLDYILPVEKVITVSLVVSNVNSPTDLRQDHDTQILILKMDRLPCVFARLGGNAIDDRQRINLSAAALINTLFKKERIGVRLRRQVGSHHYRFLPRLYWSRFARRCVRENQQRGFHCM
jgi:hypothetical protein